MKQAHSLYLVQKMVFMYVSGIKKEQKYLLAKFIWRTRAYIKILYL